MRVDVVKMYGLFIAISFRELFCDFAGKLRPAGKLPPVLYPTAYLLRHS